MPRQGMPWQPRATVAKRLARFGAVAAAVPAIIVTGVVDKALEQFKLPGGIGNTYRILARYDGPPATS
jgi:hypothetical protein